MRRQTLSALLSLLMISITPSAFATAQNDAGLGVDAPNASDLGQTLAAGTYTGQLLYNEGDNNDWYRFVTPAGSITRLTFTATSGSLYGGIHREADGSMVQNAFASSGQTRTIETGGGAYRIGFGDNAGTGTAAYSFSLSVVAQNDAGLGVDAPQASDLGTVLAAGTYTGQLLYSVGDTNDWYRFVVPTGYTLQLTFRATSGGLYGGIHRESDGSMIVNALSTGSTRVLTAGAGEFRIGFGNNAGTGSAAYTFTLEALFDGQNDAGLGSDAPDASDLGPHLALGTYIGELRYSTGDRNDWYRFTVPANAAFRLSFRATSGGLYGGIHREADGSMVKNAFSSGTTRVLITYPGTYRIGFGDNAGTGTATYAFTIDAMYQNDANIGGDAAQLSDGGMQLIAGTYNAELIYDAGDTGDWYRYARNPCGGVIVTARSTNGVGLYVGVHREEDGSMFTNAFTNGNIVTITVATNGPFRLGFGNNAGMGYATYTFTIAPGPRQNDAGTGCDGPDNAANAIAIEPDEHNAALPYSQFDNNDWYRVDVPECSVVEVEFHANSGALYGELYRDDQELKPLIQGRSEGETYVMVAKTGPFLLRFGDDAGTGTASYTFTVNLLVRGNIATCALPLADSGVGASLVAV